MEWDLHYDVLETPIGKILLVASKKGIISLNFISEKENTFLEKLKINYPQSIFIKKGFYINKPLVELYEYFKGTRKEFTCSTNLSGTPFQLKVWHVLKQIPYGERSSYEKIANIINLPKGARAVGQAVSKNPVPIIIPCHRVINKSGNLGGYSGGIAIKEWLLSWEAKNNV